MGMSDLRFCQTVRISLHAGSCLLALFLAGGTGWAQPYLPHARLLAVSPCGAQAGTSVEVTLIGEDLDEVSRLIFGHQGLRAEPVPDPKKPGTFVPKRFKITVPADVPPGLYDVRAVTRWGISNPRLFVVGDLKEVNETEPNNDVSQAQKVEIGTTINGVINPNVDVDYFAFTAQAGQRVIVRCDAQMIDSLLDPYVQVFDASGRLLARSWSYRGRNTVAEIRAPSTGTYLVRLNQFTYLAGGEEYFYRLTISTTPWIDAVYPPVVPAGKSAAVTLYGRNLPGGQPDAQARIDGLPLDRVEVSVQAPPDAPQLIASVPLAPHEMLRDGFEYRLKSPAGVSNPVVLSTTTAPIVLEQPENDSPEKAQPVEFPAELVGRIDKPNDRDWYVFSAKQNEVFVLEAFAQRLGAPVDVYFLIRRADTKQVLAEVDDTPEILDPLNTRFYSFSTDPVYTFVAPADGKYELLVGSRTSTFQYGPRHIYWLSVRRPHPDFRVFAVEGYDYGPAGITVPRGGSGHYVHVFCLRKDGFAGEVRVQAEGLPGGVNSTPQVFGPGVKSLALVMRATADAPMGEAPVRIKGTAQINGQSVAREARPATLAWPSPEGQNQPGVTRLCQSLFVAVREKPPYNLRAETTDVAVPPGGRFTVKLRLERLWPDVKVPVNVQAAYLVNNLAFNNNNVAIAPDKNEVEAQFEVPGNFPPGAYNITLVGTAQLPFNKDPKANQKPNHRHLEAANPVTLTVYNQVAQVSLEPQAVTLKPGGEAPVTVRITRLHGYTGELKVNVQPQGLQGVTAADVSIPANANEARLVLKAAPNAPNASNPNVVVRLTASVQNIALNHEAKLSVTVAK